MLIEIEKIQVKDRIRQSYGDIEELANDIKENGLINPPVVTPEYELIAGERRLKALQMLNYKQIEVRVMAVNDAEHQLNLEISENEVRKDFSKLERLDYANRLRRIESIKAEQRRKATQNNDSGKEIADSENFRTQDSTGRTNDIVAEKMGMGSGRQYEKELFIADNADSKTLTKWDTGDISTHKAYIKIKQEKEAAEEKIKGLENQVKGYQMKLEVAKQKNENPSEEPDEEFQRLLDEKEELQQKLRNQYEATQQLKEKIEESKKDVKKSKEFKELQSRVDGYQGNLNNLNKIIREQEERLAVFEKEKADKEFLKANINVVEPVEVQNVSLENLLAALQEYNRFTNIYTFGGGVYPNLTSAERKQLSSLCNEAVVNTNKIITNIKGVA